VGTAGRNLQADLRAVPPNELVQRLTDLGSAVLAALDGHIKSAMDEWPPPHAELVAIHNALLHGCTICGDELDPNNENDFREFWKTDVALREVWAAWHTRNKLRAGASQAAVFGLLQRMAPKIYKHHSTVLNLHLTDARSKGGNNKNKQNKDSKNTAQQLARERWQQQIAANEELDRIGDVAAYVEGELIKRRLKAPILDILKKWLRPVADKLGIRDVVSRPGASSEK
jgi:hypothetical protein